MLRIKHADGSMLKCNWIASAVHRPGSVTLTLATALRPYLLELRGRFTILPLVQIAGLRNQYSIRLYMLLIQHRCLGRFELSVDDFKEMLGLDEQYAKFYDLRRYVLETALEDLAKKADISFRLETKCIKIIKEDCICGS
jgi:plasmid replication initiation protein